MCRRLDVVGSDLPVDKFDQHVSFTALVPPKEFELIRALVYEREPRYLPLRISIHYANQLIASDYDAFIHGIETIMEERDVLEYRISRKRRCIITARRKVPIPSVMELVGAE